jgi:hypothetical protein
MAMSQIARIPTPIFNTPEIPFIKAALEKDSQGRLTEMETIAFPGTKFKCLAQISKTVLQVETSEYRSSLPLYVDSRFLQEAPPDSPERDKVLPSLNKILQWMEERRGLRYFWGGNWHTGIPEMLQLYPHLQTAPKEDQDDAICRGLDCSGLLHQATQGITPRNTSDLVNYGQELPFHHLSVQEIQAQLKPLDLLVWRGHVIIVRCPKTVIESRISHGVVVTDFETRYAEVVQMLKQQNKTFYFRRWHPSPQN